MHYFDFKPTCENELMKFLQQKETIPRIKVIEQVTNKGSVIEYIQLPNGVHESSLILVGCYDISRLDTNIPKT